MNSDGSDVRQITRNGLEDGSPAWSPDGTRIAFTRGSAGSCDIYVINADGSGGTRLTFDGGVQLWTPTWSPDGTRIAYQTGDPWYPYDARIVAMGADGSDPVTLVADPAGDHQPSWGPDGRIAFTSDGDIFAIRPDGTGRIHITSGWPLDAAPAWSRDGKRIVFASERRVPAVPES